ncbi:MAG: DUF2178 domain-containing protein [Candidatus Methanoperedens sp.]|nr:DUF2178 domain-containing protein [Candidatus Methanoperedens sp.]
MKLKKNPNLKWLFVLSILMILFGLINIAYKKSIGIHSSGYAFIGILWFLYYLHISKKSKTEILTDEREIRIREKSAYKALQITLAYIMILSAIDMVFGALGYYGNNFMFFMTEEDLIRSVLRLTSILSIIVVSWVLLILYYGKKEELN